MSKSSDKVLALKKYAEDLKNRISNRILPERRKNQEVPYFEFLKSDLRKTESAIERLQK